MDKEILFFAIIISSVAAINAQQNKLFNIVWDFIKGMDTVFSNNLLLKNNKIQWEQVSLPHIASIELIEKSVQQWQHQANVPRNIKKSNNR
jgi:GTP-dependent phosphoenolpyruvate carboxykinase